MDLGVALTVAQTLFSALQCSELKEISSIFGYKSQLAELQRTVSTVKAVLRDADNKQKLSHEAQLWIQELKDAVYDADDLFDMFVTLTRRKQLSNGGKASEKFHRFFSRENPLGVAYKMFQGVKKIRKNLEAIANNHAQFDFSVDVGPARKRREETCSYVYEGSIIGREDEVENVVGHLLSDSNVQQNVSVLTIVGIGGLGKTALAQLVYNDARVTTAFPRKFWTCVSDHDQKELDVEEILHKILASTGEKVEARSMELLQKTLRKNLTDRKYLLILDDVWTENRIQWLKLVEFLLGGQRGSWIVITTRSHETARIVGGGPTYELPGLSKENSWCLFKKTAFGSEHSNPHDDLVKIGQGIVEGCAGVPLAIRVAGSLLYGQDKSKWLSFQKIGLSNLRESQENIMPILKLSYDQLEPSLKSCFTYCALFPKDFVIRKELLIDLWMAQDYIVPLDDTQSMEDAAEEYFRILLRRCFFQDVIHNTYGDIVSCKIHDLMHDIAQNIAGKEICVINSVEVIGNMIEKARHLVHTKSPTQYFFSKTHIRSVLSIGGWSSYGKIDQSSLEALLSNWTCLRVLDLTQTFIQSLSPSIGNLLHLRYLDLSYSTNLEILPKSISKLYNLQTLKLYYCFALKELPQDLKRLVNLRNLGISHCDRLTNMPEGMSKLTCLERLSTFIIKNEPNLREKKWFDQQLGELKKLEGLKGWLDVRITVDENSRQVEKEGTREGAYLKSKEHLNHVTIHIDDRGNNVEAIRLMEELQPHHNLKGLTLVDWKNKTMPSWLTSLPNLIQVYLSGCGMEYLACLGNLHQLRILHVRHGQKLKYMIEKSGLPPNGIFPCLSELNLENLQELKGWKFLGKGMGVGDNVQQLHVDVDTSSSSSSSSSSSRVPLEFPQLKSLCIGRCPNLRCSMLCPNLEELELRDFNKDLKIITHSPKLFGDEKAEATSSSTSSSSYDVAKLREVSVDDAAWLNSLPMETFQCVAQLSISLDKKVKSLGEAAGVAFRGCSSSLKSLTIYGCSELRNVLRGGMEHLKALENLRIIDCPKLRLSGKEEGVDDIGMPWPFLLPSLHNLALYSLPKMVDIPNWMQSLTALQSLTIDCESLPEWVTSLRNFEMTDR